MGEGFELPESHHGGEDDPLILPVSITISIMAVLVAAVTLMGHRTHTEELLRQSQAADKWAQYQAKSVRLHETQGFSDVVNIVASMDKEKGEALREKYVKEVEHYQSDKEDISKEAKDLEADRDLAGRKADRFDGGEAFLEIGLVICSITMLTKRKLFWFGGILVGAMGIGLALTGFLLH
jgi:ABC-type nickel/cobalt efflux system permease component RcnA